MLNLNLLPPSEKIAVAYELRTRAVVGIAVALAAVLGVASVLLLPTFLFLSFQKDDMVRLRDLDMEIQVRTGSGKKADRIAAANQAARAANTHATGQSAVFPIIASVMASAPAGVRLDAIGYERSSRRLEIDGFAPSRELLLAFLRALDESPHLAEASSPVSDLIRGEDINFSIVATLP